MNVEEAPLNRTNISPTEIDNLYIDLQIDPDDEIAYEFDISDSDKEIDDRSEETDGDINSDYSE
ncbi:hypothetical protein TIFTF001_000091 [Ficus carica]|uniref:Uncharacterized protein n=1 Tax=Ficus carica TaxID=3494 RepID=A0AA88D0B5_FICCA|nr:hypothetical protein TIFTF001_000091 [Ficus carica]